MADSKISVLTPITAPQDPTKIYVPLFAQDGSPLNARMNFSEMFKTPAAATFTGAANAAIITATGYSLTGSNAQSLIDVSGTWNTTGTPTLVKINVTDTASNAASKLLDLQVGGSTKAAVDKAGIFRSERLECRIGSTLYADIVANVGLRLQQASLSVIYPSGMALREDASDVIALRRDANAELIRVYETYTDSTTFSRGVFGFRDAASGGTGTGSATTVLRIGTEKGSVGGTSRAVSIVTDGTERINISGTANTVTLPSNSTIAMGSGSILRTQYINDASNAVSLFVLNSNGNAIFSDGSTTPLFQFAGSTSSFPALKRSGTEIQVRLANDSGFASLATGTVTIDEAKNVVLGTTTGTKIGTATGQKIGFWNATPVVQQVLATGGGATVDNVITLLQTLGLCKQS